ncbi:hypothetical protein Trco_005952 [Trichoderma cornu-damae]|uniref:Uncharacterized protein n=1 Tax=Trichoderma cornu-damae TaxID=654480 RepID=A0A9P8TVQ3_9HYPO|nr:hypothetical protein Trco_005952 [Trichoderma cornu-damae]
MSALASPFCGWDRLDVLALLVGRLRAWAPASPGSMGKANVEHSTYLVVAFHQKAQGVPDRVAEKWIKYEDARARAEALVSTHAYPAIM